MPRAEGSWDPLAGTESKMRHPTRQSSRTATTTETLRRTRHALTNSEPPHDLVLLHRVDMIDVHHEHRSCPSGIQEAQSTQPSSWSYDLRGHVLSSPLFTQRRRSRILRTTSHRRSSKKFCSHPLDG